MRYGNEAHPFGLACLLATESPSHKWMYVGKRHAGESWIDVLHNHMGRVVINPHGYGCFLVSQRSVSVWVSANAKELDMFGSL